MIRVIGKPDLELMVNAAFIFEDFSSIKRESSELVDDVFSILREGFAASAGIFKFSHEKSAWYASICAVIAHTSRICPQSSAISAAERNPIELHLPIGKTGEIIITNEDIYCRYRQDSKPQLVPIILAIIAMKLGVIYTYNAAS